MRLDGLTLAPLDPSAPASGNTITKAAIDATFRQLPAQNPKPAPRNRVSDGALAAATAAQRHRYVSLAELRVCMSDHLCKIRKFQLGPMPKM